MKLKSQNVQGWLLFAPAAILLVAFTHYPTIATFINSLFTNSSIIRPSRFSGFESYQSLASDPVFWKVLVNNMWLALGTIPTSIALAIIMALIVNKAIAGRGFLRMAYFTPTMLPMIAVANIWLFFYAPEIGLLDKALAIFGVESHNWLGNPTTVLPAIIVMTIWKEAGFFMIFYLAGLQTISPELEEAAKLEGSSRWNYFWRVQFPLLLPTTLFVFINAFLNSFKLVDHLFVLTKGGPDNASNLILYYIYETAFSFLDVSYASALTVVLLITLAIAALGQFFFMDKRVHYR
jgi:sn-glycerol 3-phosphate transport system permease protein